MSNIGKRKSESYATLCICLFLFTGPFFRPQEGHSKLSSLVSLLFFFLNIEFAVHRCFFFLMYEGHWGRGRGRGGRGA